MDAASVAKAIAAFERTLLSFDAPYDRYRRGDRNALSASARRGMALFFGAYGCSGCHGGPAFSDARYHRLGGPTPGDPGLAEISGDPADTGRFRTPGLRNAALGAPYMHDGAARTLALAIAGHYGKSPEPALARPDPDSSETRDLVAFLDTLTDTHFVKDKRFALPPACTR